MKNRRSIGHWRFIDGDELAQRTKALPLGPEVPFEAGQVRGEPWMQRVLDATSNHKQKTDEKYQEILKENQEAEKQLKDVQKTIEKRRQTGDPFNIEE